HQLLIDLVHKLATLVGDDDAWTTVAIDQSQEEIADRGSLLVGNGLCLGILGEQINSNSNVAIVACSLRQRANKINAHGMPDLIRDRHGMEWLNNTTQTRIVALTSITAANKILDIILNPNPVIPFSDLVAGLVTPKVTPTNSTNMTLSDDSILLLS